MPLSRRQLLRRLPALGALLAGVATLRHTDSQFAARSGLAALRLPTKRRDVPIHFDPDDYPLVQEFGTQMLTVRADVVEKAAHTPLDCPVCRDADWAMDDTGVWEPHGASTEKPYAGIDHGPRLSPPSAADLEPGEWVTAFGHFGSDPATLRGLEDGAARLRSWPDAAGRET